MNSTDLWARRGRAAAAWFVTSAVTSFGPESLAKPADWPRVQAALSRLPTITGQSVLARMRACRITLDRRRSHLTKAGDHDELWVPVTIPNGPNDHYLPTVISWMLRDGEATPTSWWAQKLQERPGPLGFDGNMRC